jgi:3-isopropylmalate/(R)-2-methylmalate dehydratase small subunit
MQPFTTLTGVAAPMRNVNIDTDQIIPKNYLKDDQADWARGRPVRRHAVSRGRVGEPGLRPEQARLPERPDPCGRRQFRLRLVPRARPWALLDFGIRCVISTSFADIFYNNCFKNGVLPIVVSPETLEQLFDDADRGANATLTIDLASQTIQGPDGGTVKFDIDPFRKHCMLNGLDDIGLTLEQGPAIEAYEKRLAAREWA